MNDLLRDLVVKEKVAVFIDDVIVAIETEKGHDEIVEEVLRRLEFICKTRKVYVEGQRSRIFGSNNRGRQNENGEEKDIGSNRVAGAKECEGCAKVFGTSKLL